MKKAMFILIGIVIGIVGTSYATYKLTASQVSFDKSKTNLNSDNVQDILDELTTDILSYGDAESSDILEGKTALVNGKKITGTIENRGQLNWKPNTSTTYTVPAGYYTGGTLDSSLAYSTGKKTPAIQHIQLEGGGPWTIKSGLTLWTNLFIVPTKLRHTASSGVWVWFDYNYNSANGNLSITYRRETSSAGYFGTVDIYYIDI